MDKLWYGFSEKSKNVHFFAQDPGRETPETGPLIGTGSLEVEDITDVQGIRLTDVSNQNQSQSERQPTVA